MDTRTKIVSQQVAAARTAGTPHVAYVASFDVLTVARVRRVRECAQAGSLFIAVIPEQTDSLLPARARAELAASLTVVDLVVIGPFASRSSVDDREADRGRMADLMQTIHKRNKSQ